MKSWFTSPLAIFLTLAIMTSWKVVSHKLGYEGAYDDSRDVIVYIAAGAVFSGLLVKFLIRQYRKND